MTENWRTRQARILNSGSPSKIRPFGVLHVLLLSMLISSLCQRLTVGAPRLELDGCTRIEIRYAHGGLEHFMWGREDILSREEKEYVRSLGTRMVTDANVIREFIRSMGQPIDSGQTQFVTSADVYITCWRAESRLISFTVHGTHVFVEDGRWFQYPEGMPNMAVLEPATIQFLKLRRLCAMNLDQLVSEGLRRPGEGPVYPDSSRWCDVIVETLRSRYFADVSRGITEGRSFPDPAIAAMFTCPGVHRSPDANEARQKPMDVNLPGVTARRWKSDYAMNCNCRSDSPGDTVLLFEARLGWNQRGGAELFTFEHHDPRGGLVLLKDGKMKFIRTEEELKQLRWK
jgi:hypothetical protein